MSDSETSDWDESPLEACAPVVDFFSDCTFDTVDQALQHAKTAHQFDFRAIQQRLGLDTYGSIKLVNFVRRQHLAGQSAQDMADALQSSRVLHSDDSLFKPVIDNDAMIQGLNANDDDWSDSEDETTPQTQPSQSSSDEKTLLRRRNAELQAALTQMQQTFKRVALQEPQQDDDDDDDDDSDDAEAKKADDQYYFDGYGESGIHDEMLSDTVRTEAYRDFMLNNPDTFKDKVVLDVGCGTGILSMFAAKAGAKRVVAVDNANIIDKARQIVKANGLDDRITLIRGRLEDISLPDDVKQFDIIISEWMGYFLLFENMLPAVLYARDHWLAPGGLVHPDKASMHAAGVESTKLWQTADKRWHDVYGFNMSCMQRGSMLAHADNKVAQPIVDIIDPAAICTDSVVFQEFDMMTVADCGLDFESDLTLTATKACVLDAIMVHFDIGFHAGCANRTDFSTSATSTPTHWKQTVFRLPQSVPLAAGEAFGAHMTATRNKTNPRNYDVVISYDGHTQIYDMD